MQRSAASEVETAEAPAAAAVRPLWLAIHRYMGLATLVFLGLAALTGSLLVFVEPLDAALNPDLFKRPEQAMPIDALRAVAALEAARPELRARSFPLNPAPGETL